MKKFTIHSGIAAPLLRDNIDTDSIIPSREMKTVSKSGLGIGLFSAWRYLDEKARTLNPDFVLNKPQYQNASILISSNNFGCGSSREHAVWALKDFGIRCIIADSFGSIFARNCLRNGLLPIELISEKKQILLDHLTAMPEVQELTIDLINCSISAGAKLDLPFNIIDSDRNMLLEGLDQIKLTQKHQQKIEQFRQRDRQIRPWVCL